MTYGLSIYNNNNSAVITHTKSLLSLYPKIMRLNVGPTYNRIDNTVGTRYVFNLPVLRHSIPGIVINRNIRHIYFTATSINALYFNNQILSTNNTNNDASAREHTVVIGFFEGQEKYIDVCWAMPFNLINTSDIEYSVNYGLLMFGEDNAKIFDSRHKLINKNKKFDLYFLSQDHVLKNNSILIPNNIYNLSVGALIRTSPDTDIWQPANIQRGINNSHRTGWYYPHEGNPYPYIPQFRGKALDFYML